MKHNFSSRYRAALLSYLRQDGGADLQRARGWGEQARAAGISTRDLTKLHEKILVAELSLDYPAKNRLSLIKKSGIFFTEAVVSTKKKRRSPIKEGLPHNRVVEMLSQRTVALATSNMALELEIAHRKAVEMALKKSENHYGKLLKQSDALQRELRHLSRRVLTAQEEERKQISRELHDVIAQTLTGINVRLAALAKEATLNTKGLDQNIARTQKLVEKSVDIVHKFARELRPAVLDDLGLIPALHSFMKNFAERTGVHAGLTACAKAEELGTARRTALYRVAQEAFTNIDRHARATRVHVSIQTMGDGIAMTIKDNGISFEVKRAMDAKWNRRLGLFGMRERIEMVGGKFSIASTPGHGTTIMTQIPLDQSPRGGGRKPPQGSNHGPTLNNMKNRRHRLLQRMRDAD